MKLRKRFSLSQILLACPMILFSFAIIIPLLNILAKSLSDPAQSPLMNGLEILPRGFSLVNYQVIFNHPVLMRSIWNSLFITVVGTLINIVLTTMAAYALTRPKLPLKGVIMGFLICMMLFDPGLVPEYLTIQKLGLMGSQWAVILVNAVNVYYLVVLMRFFEEVPQNIYEAARIDGAGHFRILREVVLPLATPGVATVTMFYAIARWNEYFKSGIYITSEKNAVLQTILRQFTVANDNRVIVGAQIGSMVQLDYEALKCATIVVAIIPILLIYPFVLKYYAKDIMEGGVKE